MKFSACVYMESEDVNSLFDQTLTISRTEMYSAAARTSQPAPNPGDSIASRTYAPKSRWVFRIGSLVDPDIGREKVHDPLPVWVEMVVQRVRARRGQVADRPRAHAEEVRRVVSRLDYRRRNS